MLDFFLKVKKFLGRRGSGNFSSILYGSGVDLAEQRLYSQGDEKRSINWKMSAKYDKLFINLFHDEKALDVHLLCDVNYNRKGKNAELFMRFFGALTSYFQSKKAHITGQLKDKSFGQLENVGNQKRFLEAVTVLASGGIPYYTSSLSTLLKKELSLPKRRLILVVSDFLDHGEEEKRLISQLRQKHDVKLVQIPTESNHESLAGVLSLANFEQ